MARLKGDQRIDVYPGAQISRLTALTRTRDGRRTYWECRCVCGKNTKVREESLRTGNTTSCGCWPSDRMKQVGKTHGLSKTPEYRTWQAMKRRCTSPADAHYSSYGGRGIKVCDRWLNSFENFLADMGKKPAPKYTLDRIDNNGNYEPSNCRWATRMEQSSNIRSNRRLLFNGEEKTVAEWARTLGTTSTVIFSRLRYGWSVEDTLTKPIQPFRALAHTTNGAFAKTRSD
jgi:hypothetical protein